MPNLPNRNVRPEADFAPELEDVEWELMCSAREATVGLIPSAEEWSLIASAERARPHPWEGAQHTLKVSGQPGPRPS